MTAAEWLADVQDAILGDCVCSQSVIALDAVEKAIAAPSDANLYGLARDEVEVLSALCPVHAAVLFPHL